MRRRFHPVAVACFCCLALLPAPRAARGQEILGDWQRPPDTPFAFSPIVSSAKLRGTPGVMDPNLLGRWLAAIREHRPGEHDAAVTTLGPWSNDRLARAVWEFQNASDKTIVRPRWELVQLAAILHTDIAIGSSRTLADSMVALPKASLHFGVAFHLVDYLRREQRSSPFIAAWYRSVAAFLLATRELVSAPVLLRRAVRACPDNVDLLTMAGSLHEWMASPVVQESGELNESLRQGVRPADANLTDAESFLRRALKADDNAQEARVHLARVLVLRGRYDDTVALLNTVVVAPIPAWLKFDAYLFLGQAEAGRRRTDAARAAFARALELYPDARSGHLALSLLERQNSDRARAVAALQGWLDQARPEEQADADPMERYVDAGPARAPFAALDELRAAFRGPS